MTNGRSRISEVLYDSETMLRLVDSELAELKDERPKTAPEQITVLLAMMSAASDEINEILSTLYASRVVLHDATLQELHDSTAKLNEVSCATEIAATSILDGLERAHEIVGKMDELDDAGSAGSRDGHRALRGKLRDELFGLMGSLQFQDITAQQLGHVGEMLGHVESRLKATSALLDGGRAEADGETAECTFAESASTLNSRERQATADALFWRPGMRSTPSAVATRIA